MFLSTIKAEDDRSPFGDFWFESLSRRSISGVRVSPDQAMRLAAVFACVSLLAKSFASMPFKLYRPREDGGRDLVAKHWLQRLMCKRPNDFQNPFEWRQMVMAHLALRGNAYNRIFTNGAGDVTDLIPQHPDRITPEILPNGDYRYRIRQRDGTDELVPRGEIWHLRWLSMDGYVGLNPIEYARDSIGISLAAQEYGARFFQNDARPGGGWISLPGKFKGDDDRKLFKETWQAAQSGENRHKAAVLENGMEYHELGIKNNDAQFLETRKFGVTDVARLFGVPPHMVGDLDRSTNNNIETQSLEFLIYTLAPIGQGWKSSISYSLLLDEGADDGLDPDFDPEPLLRGDRAARVAFYKGLFGIGVYSPNDIRVKEGENPVDGGDNRFVPVNLRVLEEDMSQPLPPQPGPGDGSGGGDPEDTQDAGGAPEGGDAAGEIPADRFTELALAGAERLARKEVLALSGARNGAHIEEFYRRHAKFVAEALRVTIAEANAYCARQVKATLGQTIDTILFERATRDKLVILALTGKGADR